MLFMELKHSVQPIYLALWTEEKVFMGFAKTQRHESTPAVLQIPVNLFVYSVYFNATVMLTYLLL